MKQLLSICLIVMASSLFAAEILGNNSSGASCDEQAKQENCVVNYCSLSSPISESTDCEAICSQCARRACEVYPKPSEICDKLSL